MAVAAKRLFHASGALALLRFHNRGYLRILMYHRFAETSRAQLDRQCRHLKRHYHPLSLGEVARLLSTGDPFPANALAITVDDGHADFYHQAFPVFREWGLPATLYLTTDYLDGRCWLWFDLVDYLFEQTKFEQSKVPPPAEFASAAQVNQAAVRMTNAEREDLMARLPEILKVKVPERVPARWEPLSWDQVREMAAHGIEFGAHTLTHPILSHVADEQQLEREIRDPKKRIEQELDREAIHFCYPNGMAEDFTPCIVERVREAGFRTAVTAQPGLNPRGAAPFLLQRVPVEPDREWGVFTRAVAGYRLR
jgi:peptidoglycan/xylan/chitin deacetylase (PgdA/CDA1 family)